MPARKKRPLTVAITGPDKDGRYHGFVQVGTKANGKPDRRHRSGPTYEAVEAKLRELEDARETGQRVATGRPLTVEQWLTHWLEQIVRPNRKPKTYAAYRPLVYEHLIPGIGGRRLAGTSNLLTPEDIEAVYAKMRDSKHAPSYVHACHRVLRRALRLAVKRGKARENFALLAEAPSIGRRRRVKAHSLDEAKKLLSAIGRSDLPARWLVGVLLGLRQGEVLGLRWSLIDIDSKTPSLRVEKQAQRREWQHGCDDPRACAQRHCRTKPCGPSWGHGCGDNCGKGNPRCCPDRVLVHCKRHRRDCPPICPLDCVDHARACPERTGGGVVLVDLKSEDSERTVELPPVVVQALREHRQHQREARLAAGRWGDADLVFTGAAGQPIDPRRDHEGWERLLADAGLPDAPLHAARHTAATMLLLTGTDVRVVQAILGHSDIRVTQLYADVAAELRRQALERMADQLGLGLLPTSATTLG